MRACFLFLLLVIGIGLQAQPQAVDLRHVWLNLEVTNSSTAISGYCQLTFEVLARVDELQLELSGQYQVSGVEINGTATSFLHQNDSLLIPANAEVGQVLTCVVHYMGEIPASSGVFSGINNATSNSWGNRATWTLSEPLNAKYWWPARQVLSDKIDSAWIFLTTDTHLTAASNGLLEQVVNLENNRHRYEWKTRYPMAYYLLSLTVAEYVEYNTYAFPAALAGDSVLIQNYIYNNPETLPHFQPLLDEVDDMLELFSEHFGLYPFHAEKYGHAMAPFSGGMEHQTMSTMGLFTFGLDAHELGHQWFGNLVTCGTWQDIWINEGFARWTEYFATEKLLGQSSAQTRIIDDMLSVTGTPDGSVYVPAALAADPSRIFNFRLTYAKGGLLVHMMRQIVQNDSAFLACLRQFLVQFKDQTATGAQFRDFFSACTGVDFIPFFEEWYFGEGFPIYDISAVAGESSLQLLVNQIPSATNGPFFTTPMDFELTYVDNRRERFRLAPAQSTESFVVNISGEVKQLHFDPDEWLVKKVSRFEIRDAAGNPLGRVKTGSLRIYPNPTADEVRFSEPLQNIQIWDTAGRLVFTENTKTSGISLKKLRPGSYLLRAETEVSVITERIIKY